MLSSLGLESGVTQLNWTSYSVVATVPTVPQLGQFAFECVVTTSRSAVVLKAKNNITIVDLAQLFQVASIQPQAISAGASTQVRKSKMKWSSNKQ